MKDISVNGYYWKTYCKNGQKYLCIISNGCGRKRILEKLMCRSCGLYLTTIRIIESNKVLEMISWILTHIGFNTTIWDIQVVI